MWEMSAKRFAFLGNWLVIGTLLGVAYWFIDAAVMAFVLGMGEYADLVLNVNVDEIWMRSAAFVVLVIFGGSVDVLLAKRRRTEQALRESEERFREFFEKSPTPMRVVDFSRVVTYLDGLTVDGDDLETWLLDHPKVLEECAGRIKVVDANEAAVHLFGAKDKAQLLERVRNLFTPNTYKHFAEQFARLRIGAGFVDLEMDLSALDGGRRDVMARWVVLPGYEKTLGRVLVSLTDITERKRAEEALRRSHKMEAVGQLTGGIAHDFNNILGIVIGNLELLERTLADDPKPLRRAKTALKAAMRGADLTGRLLSFARAEAGSAEPTSMNQVIGGMKEFLAESLTKAITVETRLGEDLWPVKIDPGELEDAILNLAINSRDAMAEGGTLVIETANERLDSHHVERNPEAGPGDHVTVTVSDTGAGMTQETVERIFEPFFSTKEKGKGTGLGLSMVYGFVKRSGGHITVHSQPGKGTTFRLYFPRCSPEDDRVEATGEAVGEEPRGGETILVVDDEEHLADVTTAHLEELGYGTLTAHDGKQALEFLAGQHTIDLLLSDVVMPGGIDGYKLAREALKKRPTLKALLTSGDATKSERRARDGDPLVAALTATLLSKPYGKAELARSVRRVLDEKRVKADAADSGATNIF
jgi:signal transduction histidine kinase/FixJ family two-component response regulator